MATRKLLLIVILFGWVGVHSCVSEKDYDRARGKSASEESLPEQEGMKRFFLRFNCDAGVFDAASFPTDFSSKTVLVNGLSYKPQLHSVKQEWFVDVESSPFGVYVAYMLESDNASFYGENPAENVLVPNAQFLHKKKDLQAIPLFARFDSTYGSYLDFRPPYAVLDFVIPGTLTSVKLSSDTPVCGLLSWNRSENVFLYGDASKDLVLNCTGGQGAEGGHYPLMVFGQELKGVTVRACDNHHHMFEVSLGDIDLEPGSYRRFSLDGRSPVGMLWFEGFDLCAWGGAGYFPEGRFLPARPGARSVR